MKYRQFGDSGISLSVVGYGTWPLGGDSYGAVNDTDSLAALEYAFDQGIAFYDTAPIYGEGGYSETLLGKAFKNKRDKVVLSTKAGYRNYRERIQNFSDQFLRESLEASLRRLKSDYVDVFFLHSPPPEIVSSDHAYETLCRLKDEGKINYTGISVRTAEDGLLALQLHDWDAIQVTHNLLNQSPKYSGLLEIAGRKKTCIVAKAPLCYGFLTGKYTTDSRFGEDDHRHRLPKDQRDRWIAGTKSFRFLSERRTMPQSALLFCLAEEGVTTAIPGMKTVKQVEENIAALSAPPLVDHELDRISMVYSDLPCGL